MVNISEVGSTEKVPVPVHIYESFPLKLLERYFPQAAGLYFQVDGEKIPVKFDQTYTNLLAPYGGWDRNDYYIVRASYGPKKPALIDSRSSALPLFEGFMDYHKWMNEFLFFTEEENGSKSCVVALTRKYLVTFFHGMHRNYVKDSTVVVVSVKSGLQYEATVVYICEEEAYVILKSNEEVMGRNCPVAMCDVKEPFTVCSLSFGKEFQGVNLIHGTVQDVHPVGYENKNGKLFGPFIFGTAKTSPGDCGAACFGTSGLMAINLGNTTMPQRNHDEATSGSATFLSKNYMVSAFKLFEVVVKLEQRKPPKCPDHVIEIEGYGRFEF